MKEGHKVAELFAGVGGFRIGLQKSGWNVIWSNQWEPSTKAQHASMCYRKHFGSEGHFCEDIAIVLGKAETGELEIPDVDLVCGGFPCQDYSVAKALSRAGGLSGDKGALWWEIARFLRLKRPPYLFLENVDRLLKSPANQRGRDFATMIACLNDFGYIVEWRVVNAADYGFPQRRRRVFLVGILAEQQLKFDALTWLAKDGVLARALPVRSLQSGRRKVQGSLIEADTFPDLLLEGDAEVLVQSFGKGLKTPPFLNAGVAIDRKVWTRTVEAKYRGRALLLADVLESDADVDESFFVTSRELVTWKYLKRAKREERQHAGGGKYVYAEGGMIFPDPLDQPSRTILTGEAGRTPSRFKHVIGTENGRHRRLTPVELERLNGFPDNWTDTGMSASRRAFVMGNAIVVGLVERVGASLKSQLERDRQLIAVENRRSSATVASGYDLCTRKGFANSSIGTEPIT